MNARPDPAGAAAHRATRENLPWLFSCRLGAAEQPAAQGHLRDCAACRADLAAVRRLRDRLDDPAPADPAGAPVARRAANDPRWLRRSVLSQYGVVVLLAALLAWRGDGGAAYRGLGEAPPVQAPLAADIGDVSIELGLQARQRDPGLGAVRARARCASASLGF